MIVASLKYGVTTAPKTQKRDQKEPRDVVFLLKLTNCYANETVIG